MSIIRKRCCGVKFWSQNGTTFTFLLEPSFAMNCISPRLFVSPRNLLRHFHRANRPSCQLLSSTPASQTCDEGGHPQPDFRPKRIILIRHGESQGNVDQNAYVTTADWRIPITNLGKKQAQGMFWCC